MLEVRCSIIICIIFAWPLYMYIIVYCVWFYNFVYIIYIYISYIFNQISGSFSTFKWPAFFNSGHGRSAGLSEMGEAWEKLWPPVASLEKCNGPVASSYRKTTMAIYQTMQQCMINPTLCGKNWYIAVAIGIWAIRFRFSIRFVGNYIYLYLFISTIYIYLWLSISILYIPSFLSLCSIL